MEIGVTLYSLLPREKLAGRERTRDSRILDLSLTLSPRMSPEQDNSMALTRHTVAGLAVLGLRLHKYKRRNLGVVRSVGPLLTLASNSLGGRRDKKAWTDWQCMMWIRFFLKYLCSKWTEASEHTRESVDWGMGDRTGSRFLAFVLVGRMRQSRMEFNRIKREVLLMLLV